MFTDKILLREQTEEFYEVFCFKEKVDINELKKVIEDTKEELPCEWTFDDIEVAILKKFNVEKIIPFYSDEDHVLDLC